MRIHVLCSSLESVSPTNCSTIPGQLRNPCTFFPPASWRGTIGHDRAVAFNSESCCIVSRGGVVRRGVVACPEVEICRDLNVRCGSKVESVGWIDIRSVQVLGSSVAAIFLDEESLA